MPASQRESDEGIASNILASRLRGLVAAGLLTRDDPGARHRATYSLTEAAIQLVPVLAEFGWWDCTIDPRPPDALIARARAITAPRTARMTAYRTADRLR